MKKKGFYIKKSQDGSLFLNIFVEDFKAYLESIGTEWVKFRIYQRDEIDEKGHTHNMEWVKPKEMDKSL